MSALEMMANLFASVSSVSNKQGVSDHGVRRAPSLSWGEVRPAMLMFFQRCVSQSEKVTLAFRGL